MFDGVRQPVIYSGATAYNSYRARTQREGRWTSRQAARQVDRGVGGERERWEGDGDSSSGAHVLYNIEMA